MKHRNGGKRDKNFIVAVIAIFVAITTPELRKSSFAWKRTSPHLGSRQGKHCRNPSKPAGSASPVSVQQHVEKAKPPSGPFSATLHDNQPQFIAETASRLSITFNEEYNIVTLTIAPNGKPSSNRSVLNGYSEEFTSSAGVFLVHVLNADWNSRTVAVQVSKK